MNKAAGLVVCVTILFGLLFIFLSDVAPVPVAHEGAGPFRTIMWGYRAIDLLGQMMVILAGTFGVLVLTKERIER